MAVNLHQDDKGYVSLRGPSGDEGFVAVRAEWISGSVDKTVFVAARPYRVTDIRARVDTAGTDTTSASCIVRKVASG